MRGRLLVLAVLLVTACSSSRSTATLQVLDVAGVIAAPGTLGGVTYGAPAPLVPVQRSSGPVRSSSHVPVRKGEAGRASVALTFDDGPNLRWTPQVLVLLAWAHVHATFCIIGREAEMHPALVRAIVAGGHRLCNHTWDHDEQLPRVSPAHLRDEIHRGQLAVTKASGGVGPWLFRAPAGNWSPAVERAARAEHLAPLKWSVDPRDWSRPGTGRIVSVVLATVRPGGIVLLHDGGGDRSQTLAALKILLQQLARRHYAFELPPLA